MPGAEWTNRVCMFGADHPCAPSSPCPGCLYAPSPVAYREPDGTVTVVPVVDQIEAIRARAREEGERIHAEIQAAMTDMNTRLAALDREERVMGLVPSPEIERIRRLHEQWRRYEEAMESLAAEARRRADHVRREEGVEAAPAQEGEEEDMTQERHDPMFGIDGQGAPVFIVYDEMAHFAQFANCTAGEGEGYGITVIEEAPVVEFLPPRWENTPPMGKTNALRALLGAAFIERISQQVDERAKALAAMMRPEQPKLKPGETVVFTDSDPATRRTWKIISISNTTCTIGRGSLVKTSVSLDRLKKAEEA